MSTPQTTHEIGTDVKGLIKLLAKNLYAEPDIFIREMIQNAHDAIERRRDIEGDDFSSGEIHIAVERADGKNTITFEDNGSGLTEQDIREYLSTIGRSGTDAFRQELVKKGRQAQAENLIGQFGIGLLSAFVVAREVVVETHSRQPNQPSWLWRCTGEKFYQLSQCDELPIGTRVTLYIDDQHLDVLNTSFIRKAVQRYADFLPVPIRLNQEGRINTMDAPWHRTYMNDKDRLAAYDRLVSDRFTDMALSIIPVDLQEPYSVHGVLYISNRQRSELSAPGRVDIYQSRMFITAEHPHLLPVWAKFVSGVIDTPALTPTAARDNVQQDAVFREIQGALGQVIINHLKEMSSKTPLRFQEIVDFHHYHIKGMALNNQEFFSQIAELLPFETNQGPMSLQEYLRRTEADEHGQKHILYFDEAGQATQFFMLANAKNVLVINASYTHEASFLEKYAKEFTHIKLEQLDFAGSEAIFQPLSLEDADPYRRLLHEFISHIPMRGSIAKIVRFSPVNLPAVVTLTEAQKSHRRLEALRTDPAMPSLFRELMGKVIEDRQAIPITIYLNADNPTIQALSQMNLRSEIAANAIGSVYNNAIMLSQHLITPDNAERLFQQSNQTIGLLLNQTQETEDLRKRVASLQLELNQVLKPKSDAKTPHVTCFAAFNFAGQEEVFAALCEVLQDRPYYWEVVRADSSVESPNRLENLATQLRQAHCFMVELAESNPSALLELGMILTLERPYLLLRRENETTGPILSRVAGILSEAYDLFDSPDTLRQTLDQIIQRHTAFQNLAKQSHPKFLSPQMIVKFSRDASLANAICKGHKIVEEFIKADPNAVAKQVQSRPYVIQGLQEDLRNHCGLSEA